MCCSSKRLSFNSLRLYDINCIRTKFFKDWWKQMLRIFCNLIQGNFFLNMISWITVVFRHAVQVCPFQGNCHLLKNSLLRPIPLPYVRHQFCFLFLNPIRQESYLCFIIIESNHPDSKWHKEGHQGSSPKERFGFQIKSTWRQFRVTVCMQLEAYAVSSVIFGIVEGFVQVDESILGCVFLFNAVNSYAAGNRHDRSYHWFSWRNRCQSSWGIQVCFLSSGSQWRCWVQLQCVPDWKILAVNLSELFRICINVPVNQGHSVAWSYFCKTWNPFDSFGFNWAASKRVQIALHCFRRCSWLHSI